MDLGISGRTAVISGGDSGIGLATARLLLEEGVRVALTDLDQSRLDAAMEELDGELIAVAADLTVPADVEQLRRQVLERLGAPDIIVNCAGITGAQGLFHEIDDEGWQHTVETDLMSPVRLVRAFLPEMRERGWGRIVLVASEDAVQPYADEIPYCAAKAGVLALVKGLSKTYATEGVLCNAVSPAFIATPMTDAMMDKRAEKRGTSREEAITSFLEQERPGMEVKRRGKDVEVAAVIAFLCSERASFVNGSNYRVDAGSVQTI